MGINYKLRLELEALARVNRPVKGLLMLMEEREAEGDRLEAMECLLDALSLLDEVKRAGVWTPPVQTLGS